MKKYSFALAVIFSITVITGIESKGQPIPVELTAGNKYGTVDLSFSRFFSKDSKFGFFHMNTVQFDYDNKNENSIILQDLAFVEIVKNLRIAGGVSYSKAGFSPTAGLQYIYNGKNFMILSAPRINITDDPSVDIMNIIQLKLPLTEKLKLYTRAKALNLFWKDGNIKSYQWLRVGLETGGIQFGAAINFDEYGPHPEVQTSFGVFIRKEIF